MSTTNIEWTNRVWNPVTGCRKVSPGCQHCYAEGIAHRFWHHQYVHTADRGFIPVTAYASDQMTGKLRKFTDVMCHEDRLREPLSWRRPAKVFVNSMSDLFHEAVDIAFIDRVFAVMARANRHTFQVLTKRPALMREYLTHADTPWRIACEAERLNWADDVADDVDMSDVSLDAWPLQNVWLGVSVEDQKRAIERIPLLLQTPAAVRFISAEPLLGPVDLRRFVGGSDTADDDLGPEDAHCIRCGCVWEEDTLEHECPPGFGPRLDWVIVGGESGPGARPCDIESIRSIVRQCQASGTAVFVKQFGSNPIWRLGNGWPANSGSNAAESRRCAGMLDPKGGDPSEWPDDMRVREFPR